MAELTSLIERSNDEVMAAGEQPSPGTGPRLGPEPARVAVVLMASVLMLGVVTYLGPILKPFLVAVFLYFATKAAAGFLIRRRFPAWLAYLTLLVAGSLAVAVLTLL